MTWVDVVFFSYIFIGLYMLSLLFFLYFYNRDRLFRFPASKPEPVSIVVPCYNEGDKIGATIESLLALNYPKNMLEIIVVDDKSTDNSAEVARRYARKYSNVRVIVNKRNSGGAAEPTNLGIRAARFPYIAVADADSTPEPDALLKMIGFLQEDPTVGGVTCTVLAKKPVTFIQKLQAIEYAIIAFNRKMLDMVDAVYVTPGPFALYRKKVLFEVGLFDTSNMTQDIEIVWRMLTHGYKARMCLASTVYSSTPKRFGAWWRQRIRWNIGGAQCIFKYKRYLFRKAMLGAFIIPFFSVSLFIGLFGLGLLAYLFARRFFVSYLSASYSLYAHTAIVRFDELSFTPSILNFFGISLFFFSFSFSFYILTLLKRKNFFHYSNLFNVLFYVIVYLSLYPIIMASSLYKLVRGKYSW